MALIPKETIEEIRSRCNIVDIISAYLPDLRRRGTTHKCCCPFHKEKTPSFTVNDDRQIFHCFGCGAGGDVFRFVMDYEKVDFISAVELLGDRVGVEVKFEAGQREQRGDRDRLLQLNREAAGYYHRVLMQGKEGAAARRYAAERELPEELLRLFQVGYAPDEWEGLLSRATEKGYTAEDLAQAGLVVPSERAAKKSHYDRFRGRLMFPICDTMGRVIGFSGRVMNRAEKGAKYVNSPETAIFKKSKVLFAFDKARKSIVDLRQVVLVEGQIDAMRAHQVGLTHVVASQGTALTEEHARLIKRYADEVILVFDADAAGAKAAQSSAEIFIAQELAVRVATLPEKEDPDSLIRSQGVEAMQSLLDEAVDALEFLVRTCSADPASKGEVGRMRTTRAVLDLIRKTPSATTQDDMLARASALLGVGKEVLVAELKRGAIKPVERKKTVEKEEPPQVPVSPDVRPKEEIDLLEICLYHYEEVQPLFQQYLPTSFFKDPVCRTLLETLMEQLPEELQRNINAYEVPLQRVISGLLMGKSRTSDEEMNAIQIAQSYIQLFWRRHLEEQDQEGATYEQRVQLKRDLHTLRKSWHAAVSVIEQRLGASQER